MDGFLTFLFFRTLADLYEHADWSQKSLEGPLRAVKAQVTKCKLNLMSMEHLKYYHKELAERAKAGHVSSFTTLWSLVQEMFLHGRVCTTPPGMWSCHTSRKYPLICFSISHFDCMLQRVEQIQSDWRIPVWLVNNGKGFPREGFLEYLMVCRCLWTKVHNR